MTVTSEPGGPRGGDRGGATAYEEVAGIEQVRVDAGRRTLTVTFSGTLPARLDRHSFRVEGGQRVTEIRILRVVRHTSAEAGGSPANRLTLTLDRPGDESTYRLRALGSGFRRGRDRAAFRFHPTDRGPAPAPSPEPAPRPSAWPAPAIDYLAKDFASFRRLLLERLALTLPKWTERRAPDVWVTLVELLAYVGDQLSYQQDAVATEAYLDTARLRTSVRRHARLVGYPMHEGCAARAVVCVQTDAAVPVRTADLAFTAFPVDGTPETAGPVLPLDLLVTSRRPVYRPMERREMVLRPEHNRIPLVPGSRAETHLPAGATRAGLLDGDGTERALRLVPGDLLVLEEVAGSGGDRGVGPGSGGDRGIGPDPARRQAVRLTRVTPDVDPASGTLLVDVEWADEDALTFPLRVGPADGPGRPRPTAVACGNALLVEQGIENTWLSGGGGEEIIQVPGPAEGQDAAPAPGDAVGPDAAVSSRDADGGPRTAAAARRARPFVTTLSGRHVTWSPPHPRPADLAAAQARQLTGLATRARNRLRDLHHSVTALSDEDRDFLDVLFGERQLRGLSDDDPGRVLGRLLSRFDELLEPKLRRLDALDRRARSGYVLDPEDTGWELAQTWGRAAAWAVHPDNPALHGSVRGALRPDPREAVPALRLHPPKDGVDGDDAGPPWTPRRDLLASGPCDRHVVGETDDDGVLALRFGDGRSGAAPRPGTRLCAEYRIGNGQEGNIGAEAVNRIASRVPGALEHVTGVRNPLPATGGTDPEPVAEARLAAPREPFRGLLRAVTAEDYATLAAGRSDVQRAAATLRWNGSWYEAEVAVDPLGAPDPSPRLLEEVRASLHRFRRIGHDVVTRPAVQVPLDVALDVLVGPHSIADHVRAELLRRLLPGRGPDGGPGFFDPDALTFGTPVRAGALIALCMSVPGVRNAEVTRLRRLHAPGEGTAAGVDVPPTGELRLRPLEIARLDADAAHPENGRLVLRVRGGR
ncbi:putative baseplate assembly protein [Streptomyces sioyaensis]|uniref:Putative baseplate assembly protein n=1 Tax=Streptomyces sioyaensis TaxID=67364 RepID=A0A4Q1QX65_9ACTN|nr:putative baseplate assembly protein [Streptomyces sioyaensis]MBM4796779.1 putative baseplate assembly protein [Streptomyces sioyaensis]RXS62835.1 putative baseplate assembly protein [Streptomyces sioyaensis]